MAEKRHDKKGRILRKGELQRSDGRYMYRYTNANGDCQVEYSWRLVASDPQPQGRKKELSLREKEALIEQDRFDRIVYDYNSIEVANAIMEDREPELLSNITAHILRHTACARMAESGMDQRTLQEIMGHSNLAITMKVYNHVDDKCMRDEIERFDAKRDGKNKV